MQVLAVMDLMSVMATMAILTVNTIMAVMAIITILLFLTSKNSGHPNWTIIHCSLKSNLELDTSWAAV